MLKRLSILAMAFALCVCAQTAVLAPVARQQFFDASGRPLSGGLLYTCVAATTCPGTPLATYLDSTAAVPAANPIVLDAGGRASVWLAKGAVYKFVLKTRTGALVWTVDHFPDSMTDPGSNGLVYRTGANITRAATLPDIVSLGVFALDGASAPPDLAVLNYNIGNGLLRDSGMTASAGKIGTGVNPTQITFTEGCPTSGPIAGKWTWCADATTHVAKVVGNSSTWYVGLFTTPGVTTHLVRWDAATGFADGGPASSPYPALTDALPILWDAGSLPIVNASLNLSHLLATRPLNVSNLVSGGFYTLLIYQDGTGGAALTGGTGCLWKTPGGTGTGIFPLNTGANALDSLTFTYDGANCFVMHANFLGM